MIAAIAASGTSVAQFDYVLLDFRWLESHGFDLVSTPDHGITPDVDVNEAHFDICGLSIQKLYELALYVNTLVRVEGPIVGDQVAEWIDIGISKRHIDESCLDDRLLRSLSKFRKRRNRSK